MIGRSAKVQCTLLVAAILCTVFHVEPALSQEKTTTEEIHRMLEESEVVQLITEQGAKHDRKLTELHHRLEKEITAVNNHFEEVLYKIEMSEKNFETNLERIEQQVLGHISDAKEAAEEIHGTWRWPFFFLIFVMAGMSGFFYNLYKKATKHQHLF